MHACMYTYIRTYLQICFTDTHKHVCTIIKLYIYTDACMHACIHTYIHTNPQIYIADTTLV